MSRLVEGRFLQTAAAPDDKLEVRIDGHRWPVIWSPITDTGGPLYPSVDDLALVALSDRNRAWVIAWTPYDDT